MESKETRIVGIPAENHTEYSYDELIDIIYHARRFEKRPGVEVTTQVLSQLQFINTIPYIHVAGTNGKGSVCAFLSEILAEEGLRVGRFVSPHLVDFEERIAILDKETNYIAKEDVTRLGNLLLSEDFGIALTMFDYCLVMALLYFKEQKCDVMVIETGLGGRLDSTNAIGTPAVCVITKLGLDHTEYLGNTIEQIAMEKAGIIKPSAKVVVEQQEKRALEIIENIYCTVNGMTEPDVGYVVVTDAQIEEMSKQRLSLLGTHQWENSAAAVQAAKLYLGQTQLESVPHALLHTSWGGRMELLSQNPFVLIDGAHNGNGVYALADSLKALYPNEKFHFIMAVLADKDYENMVEEVFPLARDFTVLSVDSSRALQSQSLAQVIASRQVQVQSADSIAPLLRQIVNTKPKHKTVIFGSLYFVGEVKTAWECIRREQ